MVYVDASKSELIEGFTKNTFTAMIEGIRDTAVASGMITSTAFEKGVKDLYRTCEPDGVFCYTFFKAVAVNYQPAYFNANNDAIYRTHITMDRMVCTTQHSCQFIVYSIYPK